MRVLFPFIICAALTMPALADQVEAMTHGNPQAEAAAQARVDSRADIPIRKAIQPEAQRSSNAAATAAAERRKAQRLQSPRHPADQSGAIRQYQNR